MKALAILFFAVCSLNLSAQLMEPENPPGLTSRFDMTMEQWLTMSEELKTYGGLSSFCNNAEYRNIAIGLLDDVHHYDSLLLSFLDSDQSAQEISDKKKHKALADLHQLEGKYSTRAFVDHLKENCLTYRELEKDKESLKGYSGMYSYDGQVLLVESDLQKYLKHIDKKVVSISKHLHLLNVQWVH